MIQLSPPLIADMSVIGEIVQIVGDGLTHVGELVAKGQGPKI